MDASIIQLIVFGILAAIANILGGLVIFPSKLHSTYKGALKYLLALSAGFMLAVTLFEVFPRSVELWHTAENGHDAHLTSETFFWPILLLLGGYLATQFFEHTIAPHFHLGAEVHSDHVISTGSAYAGIGGLLIHTFFDGVSIAAASQLDPNVGLLVFLAIFLHKFPEGFTVGSMILSAGKGIKEVLTATGIIGITTILGVLTFYLVGSSIQGSVAYAMPIAAGVMLYVAASDLIPEVNHHGGKKPLVSLSVFAGVALFFCLHFLVHELVGH